MALLLLWRGGGRTWLATYRNLEYRRTPTRVVVRTHGGDGAPECQGGNTEFVRFSSLHTNPLYLAGLLGRPKTPNTPVALATTPASVTMAVGAPL